MQKDVDIPDLTRSLAVITGANSGIGLGITKRLAAAGAEVIMAVRNLDKGKQALNEIFRENLSAKLSLQVIDLASLRSVKIFAEKLLSVGRPINYLINNAGLMAPPERRLTEEGLELHFAANYLGHFALTAILFPLIISSGQSRVTMISSSTNHFGKINFNDLQYERRYTSSKAYAQSKLAMLMFAIELHNKSERYGWKIVSNAAHPGATFTNILSKDPGNDVNKAKPGLLQRLGMKIPGIWQEVEKGCLPAFFAATNSRALAGAYYGPGGIFELHGFPKLAAVPHAAVKVDDLKRLWSISEKLAGVKFPTETYL